MGRAGKKHIRLGVSTDTEFALFPDLERDPSNVARSQVPRLPPQFDLCDPERSYAQLVALDHRRRFGQFFTPQPIAELLCRWAAESEPKTMLDPAAGTGVLARTFHRVCSDCRIAAIDIDSLAIQALQSVAGPKWREGISRQDFLTWEWDGQFDAIVANPPYLRHHDICYPPEVWRRIEDRSGIKVSRLTNAYVLFVLEICRRLTLGGRAGIIVPGEWLNANFGAPLKRFLLRGQWLQRLAYFSHAESLFDDALTTACLLLIQRPRAIDANYQVKTLFIETTARISDVQQIILGERAVAGGVIERSFAPDDLLGQAKWNAILEHGMQASIPGFVALRHLATTCRGIATGANSFFHLSPSQVQAAGLDRNHLRPCIGRAKDVTGYVFGKRDFERLVDQDAATQLLCAEGCLSASEAEYMVAGEQEGLPERYLLSKRTPWYAMERREPAPVWAAVFGRGELRFVYNAAGILNLTTFHAIYPHRQNARLSQALTACLNSPAVQNRARQQHRVYGGGLLKYEPKDLLDIEVPDLRECNPTTIAALERCLHELDEAARAEDARRREDVRAQLNALVLKAAAEAANPGSRTAPEDQSALGPLWAPRTHRAGQGL
jgi:adenine-specific DNA-methyltransferase